MSQGSFPIALLSATIVASPVAAQSAEDGSIDDIVVTAQKSSSALSRTPLAISAYTADQLSRRNLVEISDLQQLAPTLHIQEQASAVRLTLRGVSTDNNSAGGDPSVAFHVDGIYQPRLLQSNFGLFYDLDRIEVLRGPQGMLYGRNSTGGAINVISRLPEQNVSGLFAMGYGSYNQVRTEAALNLLVGAGALRVAGMYDNHEGFARDVLTGRRGADDRDAYAIRALYRLADGPLDLLLRVERVRFGGEGASQVVQGAYSPVLLPTPQGIVAFPLTAPIPAGFGAIPNPDNPRRNPKNDAQSLSDRLNRYSAQLIFKLSDTTDLTVLVAHQNQRLTVRFDADYSSVTILPINTGEDSNYWSAEVRANGRIGKMKWIVGLFGLSERAVDTVNADAFLLPGVPFPLVRSAQRSAVRSRSGAVFGQIEYEVSANIKVTGGLRYSADRKRAVNAITTTQLGSAPITVPSTYRLTDGAVTGRLGLDWTPSPGLLVYFNLSRGYKSGGFSAGQPPYGAEQVSAAEAGLKQSFAGGRLRVSLDAFYYDYDNLQLTYVDIVDGAPNQVTTNAGKSRINGLELEFTARPSAWLTVDGAVTRLHARFQRASLIDPANIAAGEQDLKGKALPRSPDFTARLGVQATITTGIGTFEPRADLFWSARYSLRAWDLRPFDLQPSYLQENASLRWRTPFDQLTIDLIARNISNKNIKQFSGPNTLVNSIQATYGAPRTVLLRAGISF